MTEQQKVGKTATTELDEIARTQKLDMVVGFEGEPNVVPTPKPNEIWYHGRRGDVLFKEGRPAFFARSSDDARFFSEERGEGVPNIISRTLDIKNPARARNLDSAIKETGATEQDVLANSPYSGENFIDYLYVPKVVARLKEMGFDGYVGGDVVGQMDIQIAVPFDVAQIKVGKMYNGWENYETWVVSLWLGNEEATCALQQELLEQAQNGEVLMGFNEEETIRLTLADLLKEWVKDNSPLADTSRWSIACRCTRCGSGLFGMYSDLLGVGIDEVNWWEIADDIIANSVTVNTSKR